MAKLKEYLEYYTFKLERNSNVQHIVLPIVEKLSKIDVAPDLLLNTGIYRSIRAISKSSGDCAQITLPLYNKWKAMILAEQNGLAKSGETSNNIPALSRTSDFPENHTTEAAKILTNQPTDFRNGFGEILNSTVDATNNVFSDKSFSYVPSSNNGGFTNKNLTPKQPPVNKFQPLNNNSNSSFPVQSLKVSENIEQKNVSDLSSNAHNTIYNALPSPHASNSQNAVDSTLNMASPNKIGRILDPYTIEMKEGMFRVVKSNEGLAPEIIRVRRLYNRDDGIDFCDSVPEKDSKILEKQKTPKKVDPKNIKSVKALFEKKSVEKKAHNLKSKTSTPEKGKNNHKANSVKPVKGEKSKSDSPLNKSAIEKSKLDKNVRDKAVRLSSSDDSSPHKISSKTNKESPSNIKGSPNVKSNIKGSPNVKSNIKGSPKVKSSSKVIPIVKLNIKGSPMVKSSSKGSLTVKSSTKGVPTVKSNIKGSPSVNSAIKGSPTVKSNIKGSPPFSINHLISPPCDIKKVNSGHKDCDKRTNKVLSNESSENFTSSKKERTSIYSGKKTIQELPTLASLCVRFLRKNIDRIKYTGDVPYGQLKPVLQCCTAIQLRRIEENNPNLLGGTEEIWKAFCQKKSRNLKPEPPETWRGLYWKIQENEDKKFRNLTASISAAKLKAAPERQLAIIESPDIDVTRHRSKKLKLSIAALKEAATKTAPKEPLINKVPPKESSTYENSEPLTNKVPPKESSMYKNTSKETSSLKVSSKESNLPSNRVSSNKKTKKAPVAPLMSKVKKSFGLYAMQKK